MVRVYGICCIPSRTASSWFGRYSGRTIDRGRRAGLVVSERGRVRSRWSRDLTSPLGHTSVSLVRLQFRRRECELRQPLKFMLSQLVGPPLTTFVPDAKPALRWREVAAVFLVGVVSEVQDTVAAVPVHNGVAGTLSGVSGELLSQSTQGTYSP